MRDEKQKDARMNLFMLELAERVGFELEGEWTQVIEPQWFQRFAAESLEPPEPLKLLETPGARTYCVREIRMVTRDSERVDQWASDARNGRMRTRRPSSSTVTRAPC